jgi:hypothetical protein
MSKDSPMRTLLIRSVDKRLGEVHTVLTGIVMANGRKLTRAEQQAVEAAEEKLNAVRNDIWKLAKDSSRN